MAKISNFDEDDNECYSASGTGGGGGGHVQPKKIMPLENIFFVMPPRYNFLPTAMFCG